MRHNGHNIKRHELFCQFCGRRMNKSRRDAKYHDSCRVAAWRERKFEAERAAQTVQPPQPGEVRRKTFVDQPAAEQAPRGRGTWLKHEDIQRYERPAKVFGTLTKVKPALDKDGYWPPAVNGKRLYETFNGLVVEMGCPKDDAAAARRFNE